MRRRGFKCALGKSTNPPCAPSHVPYWSLREREQSPQNQRAKSPCYTSPIFSTSPTSRPHRVAQPQLSIPVIRCWRASLKRAGNFYCHYLISQPVIIHYPALFTPPSSLSHWNGNPHHHFFCLHLFRLRPVASSFFALSLVPVISQGMRSAGLLEDWCLRQGGGEVLFSAWGFFLSATLKDLQRKTIGKASSTVASSALLSPLPTEFCLRWNFNY